DRLAGPAHHLRAVGPAEAAAPGEHAEVDLRDVRARVPDQDAGVPVPRLDAGRLPGDAAAGAGVLLRRRLEGRRIRFPAARAPAVPGGDARLPDRDPPARAGLGPLR